MKVFKQKRKTNDKNGKEVAMTFNPFLLRDLVNSQKQIQSNNSAFLTASKGQCRRIWTSFGAWDEIYSYLPTSTLITHQLLNIYCYEVAISRVQTKIDIDYDGSKFYFV